MDGRQEKRSSTPTKWRWVAGGVLTALVALITVGALMTDPPESSNRAVGDTAAGMVAFEASCAECHGTEAAGTDSGPPLVHDIYRPNHHSDDAFFLAARRGAPQHHWRFGAMPPQPDVTEEDLTDIVAYVRTLQREAGIE
jgi:mono/diheme cytochrome c family protein